MVTRWPVWWCLVECVILIAMEQTRRLHIQSLHWHTDHLYTNLIRYELFVCEPYPIRTFSVTNFLPYEHYSIRTYAYEHLLTSYEPFPKRTLYLQTLVLEASHSIVLVECWLMVSTGAEPRGWTRKTRLPQCWGQGNNPTKYMTIFCLKCFLKVSMTSYNIKWPKSKEKPKLWVGGVCRGEAIPLMYRSRPPQCQTRDAAPGYPSIMHHAHWRRIKSYIML